MATIIGKYPLDLDHHPRINFTSRNPRDQSGVLDITLYAPASIAVNDGMGFGNFDLGVIGQTLSSSVGADGKIDADLATAALTSNLDKAGQNNAVVTKAMSTAVGGIGGLGEKVADVSLFKTKTSFNPNTVLQFTGPSLRSFSFEFKMVASSSAESEEILKIINGFRSRMYPVKQGDLTFSYPDIFKVNFQLGGRFVPNYAESYLTNMGVIYNASGNAYHEDGAPTDVSVSLTFSEFKALERNEIEDLAKGNIISAVIPDDDPDNQLFEQTGPTGENA